MSLVATSFPRRDLLKAGGALLIGFALPATARAQPPMGVAVIPGPDQPDPARLDTWLAIHADNTATIFAGYAELGQGASTALLQLAAEELDLDLSQVAMSSLETHVSPNHGGTVASAAIAVGGQRLRFAAAEARAALVRLAAARLNAPVEQLSVADGVVSVRGDLSRSVRYGELLGDAPFDLPFTGTASVKPVREYKIVGVSVPRNDIPPKAAGTYVHMQHVRVPGMWHGRVVRPRGQGSYGDGARVASIEADSIAGIAGAHVVRRGDFVGVVAPNEWDAVRAARQLRVTWGSRATLRGTEGIYEQMRSSRRPIESSCSPATSKEPSRRAARSIADVSLPVSGARAVRPELRDRRRQAELRARLCSTQNIYQARAKVAGVIDLPVEQVADSLLRRFRHLRPKLFRGCGAGGSDHVPSRGQTGARAVHARG